MYYAHFRVHRFISFSFYISFLILSSAATLKRSCLFKDPQSALIGQLTHALSSVGFVKVFST